MVRTSVGKLVTEAQRAGESLESLVESSVKINELVTELNIRRRMGLLDPETSELEKTAMIVAAWFKNKEIVI